MILLRASEHSVTYNRWVKGHPTREENEEVRAAYIDGISSRRILCETRHTRNGAISDISVIKLFTHDS